MKQVLQTLQKTLVLVDDFVNKVTMYRLLLWGLRTLFVIAWIFSIAGVLPYGTIRPLVSISILIGVCLGSNYIFAKIYKVTSNNESSNLTALLLFFIFQPPKDSREAVVLGLAGLLAIASKYIITKHQRHIFNPAAFGALAVSLTGLLPSRWWIGSSSMAIFVAILAFLELRKIHRFPMFFSFTALALVLVAVRSDASISEVVRLGLLSFPVLFFGGFMLTEPVTTPPRRYQQIAYGAVVGALFGSGLHVGPVSMTPELSLILGNVLVFLAAPRSRQPLKLISREEIGRSIFEYTFRPTLPLDYKPGQYLELTLPLSKADRLGNRRTFTIASSPTEEDIILGVKHVASGSAFKETLAELPKGAVVSGNNVAGDFLLPIDEKVRLVFIAGGIGITPFRSMLKYLTDKRQSRNIVLFYAVSDAKQVVYKEILQQAKDFGLKIVYVLTPLPGETVPKSWSGEVGPLTSSIIKKHVLDFDKRQYYVSGPNGMVLATKRTLRNMKIPRDHIRTDYFAGY